MTEYYKVSKKKTRVTETKRFQGILNMRATYTTKQAGMEVIFSSRTVDMKIEKIIFKLDHSALHTPEFYLNGIKMITDTQGNSLYGSALVTFNTEDNTYTFRNNAVAEGDTIEAIYETKDEIADNKLI